MGAACENGPCISQGMGEYDKALFTWCTGKKKITAICSQLDCGCLTLIRSATEAPSFHIGVAPRQPHCHYWHTAVVQTRVSTHKQKILRKRKILISQHTLDGKCVCWQGKKAGKSVWLAGYCLNGCSTSANSPTESSSVSSSIKVSVWRSSKSLLEFTEGFSWTLPKCLI